MVNGNGKIRGGGDPLFLQKVFTPAWDGFCICRKTETTVSNKLWHSEYLSADPAPQNKSRLTWVQEADFSVFLDIPQTHENMADNNSNNNRYTWRGVELKHS